MNAKLGQIEHKLMVVEGLLRRAALDAETLSDQGLAEDLHAMHADVLMRLLPSVRRGKSSSVRDS
jgi:hypothetical protein